MGLLAHPRLFRSCIHYEYKKCRKAREKIKKSKLIEACLGDGSDLLSEMGKTSNVVETSMDCVKDKY